MNWTGATGFYKYDLRSPPSRQQRKTWAPIYLWATPTYAPTTMSVTFLASTGAYAPPSNREYLLELLSVPTGVAGAPAVGSVWQLPLVGDLTIQLPTYRTSDGLTGYQFSFTVTETEPGLGDIDNDGDVDDEDYLTLVRCYTGPMGEPQGNCAPVEFDRSDMNDDGIVDLSDFAAFAPRFTGTTTNEVTYTGADSCQACHPSDHADWMNTAHAAAYNLLIEDGEQENPSCLACHSVGYGQPGGFVDLETTPHLANVQCENCHGPGGPHVEDAEVALEVDLQASLCGQCHRSCHGQCGDYYHPTYEQWSVSKHAAALSDIRSRPDYEESCLPCHSADYRLAGDDEKPGPLEARYSLECVTCHRARGSNNISQLRLSPPALCAECHTTGNCIPGCLPDRTQYQMLHAVGGFALSGMHMSGPDTAHYTTIPNECAACHVYREPYISPELPSNAGHTFESNMRACEPCHSEADAAALVVGAYQETDWRLAALARYLDPQDPVYVDPSGLEAEKRGQYLIAKFDYEFVLADRSYGSHNINYTRALLQQAESFFQGNTD